MTDIVFMVVGVILSLLAGNFLYEGLAVRNSKMLWLSAACMFGGYMCILEWLS